MLFGYPFQSLNISFFRISHSFASNKNYGYTYLICILGFIGCGFNLVDIDYSALNISISRRVSDVNSFFLLFPFVTHT